MSKSMTTPLAMTRQKRLKQKGRWHQLTLGLQRKHANGRSFGPRNIAASAKSIGMYTTPRTHVTATGTAPMGHPRSQITQVSLIERWQPKWCKLHAEKLSTQPSRRLHKVNEIDSDSDSDSLRFGLDSTGESCHCKKLKTKSNYKTLTLYPDKAVRNTNSFFTQIQIMQINLC